MYDNPPLQALGILGWESEIHDESWRAITWLSSLQLKAGLMGSFAITFPAILNSGVQVNGMLSDALKQFPPGSIL